MECIMKTWMSGHLHPGTPLLPNVVAMHDVEDLISDGLSVATTADTAQHVAHPLLSDATCSPMSLQANKLFSRVAPFWAHHTVQVQQCIALM